MLVVTTRGIDANAALSNVSLQRTSRAWGARKGDVTVRPGSDKARLGLNRLSHAPIAMGTHAEAAGVLRTSS